MLLPRYHSYSSIIRMHFRGEHLLTLLREYPSVLTLLRFHGSHSMVIVGESIPCLAPTGISLCRLKFTYSSISLCLIGCIIPVRKTFVNRQITSMSSEICFLQLRFKHRGNFPKKGSNLNFLWAVGYALSALYTS